LGVFAIGVLASNLFIKYVPEETQEAWTQVLSSAFHPAVESAPASGDAPSAPIEDIASTEVITAKPANLQIENVPQP